jgi:hypothetical protein
MNKFLAFIPALLLVTSLSFGQSGVPVDSIFTRYYQATGGDSLWNGLKSYSMKRTYRSNTASDYDSEVVVSLPDRAMYKAKIILKRNFIYAVRGTEGWLKIPLGSTDKVASYQTKDLSQNEQTMMRMEMYDLLVPFLSYQERGYIASFVGQEVLNGKPVEQVELQGKGIKYNLYFDKTTGMLVREKKSLPGEVVVTDYSNYKKSTYGILYPATAIETNSKDKRAVTVTSVLTVNPTIGPEYFKR